MRPFKFLIALTALVAVGSQLTTQGSNPLRAAADGSLCFVKHVPTGLFLTVTEGNVTLASQASATTFRLESVDQRPLNRDVFHLTSPLGRLAGTFYGQLFVADEADCDEWSVEYTTPDSTSVFLGLRVPDAYSRQYLYWSEVRDGLDLKRCRMDTTMVGAQWQLLDPAEVDGIAPVEAETERTDTGEGPSYDLMGRPASNSHSGPVIINHQVIINK